MTTPRLVFLMLVLNVLVVTSGVAINYMMLRPMMGAAAGDKAEARGDSAAVSAPQEYEFFPIEKIIVSVREGGREHYFVLDLILQTEEPAQSRRLERIEPLVRNSVVSYLSTLQFEELRALSINQLQARLEQALFDDFASKNAETPFEQVLVSKLIVQ